jgi:hypothetical protein
LLLLVGLGLIGCSEQHPTTPDISGISAAKGGNGGKGDDPTVTGVDPTSAPQDTTLDVRVFGSGYERGSKVVFERDGVAAEKVMTNSTRFVDSGELVANMTIALDAETGLYDVAVFSSGRRKGIGAELFKVKLKGRPNFGPAIEIQFDDGTGNNIRSDGRGIYVDRECGVSATLNLEDARLDPDAAKIHPKEKGTCGSRDPRKILVDFADLVPNSPPSGQDGNVVEGTFMIVDQVEMVTEGDGTVRRKAQFQMPGCGMGLRFNSAETESTDFPVNDVDVKQNPDGTWTVKTQPPPDDVAVCVPSVQGEERRYYHMPFSVTVRLR